MSTLKCPSGADHPAQKKRGFTLIELMVVILILVLTASITVALLNTPQTNERIRSSARQIQAVANGARDRAVQARAPRGFRLIVDPVDPRFCGSLVYIGPTDSWSEGTVVVGRLDSEPNGIADDSRLIVVRGYGTGWRDLKAKGLLVDGARIKISSDSTGTWYTVSTQLLPTTPGPGADILVLSREYDHPALIPYSGGMAVPGGADGQPGRSMTDDDGFGSTDDNFEFGWPGSDDTTDIHGFPYSLSLNGESNYILELSPSILPGQEPVDLANGIVIDLRRSSVGMRVIPVAAPLLPGEVNLGPNPDDAAQKVVINPSNLDFLISPRGTVYGPRAASGLMFFYLLSRAEAILNLDPVAIQDGQLIGTLYAQSGAFVTSPVDVTDLDANSMADDPYRYARQGSLANR